MRLRYSWGNRAVLVQRDSAAGAGEQVLISGLSGDCCWRRFETDSVNKDKACLLAYRRGDRVTVAPADMCTWAALEAGGHPGHEAAGALTVRI